jgi:hypothetical protein
VRTVCVGLVLAFVVLPLGACGGGSSSGSGGAAPASVSISATDISISVAQGDATPARTVIVTVQNPPDEELHARVLYTDNGVFFVERVPVSKTSARLEIYFRDPHTLAPGDYQDEVRLSICHNESCSLQVNGSPMQITIGYAVAPFEARPERSVPALSVLDRLELTHDVVDAEYSAALDAIVMVSARPTNALHVHYPDTGVRHSVALDRTPTAVSVAPDGLSAAVGHDALISYVDLEALGDAAPAAPVLLDISTHVFDLILDGRGHVHAIPLRDPWVTGRAASVEIATNTEQPGSAFLGPESRGRLHPSGDFIYTATRYVYPEDVLKWDIRSGVLDRLYDSPYHGEYPMCGDVWISEDGATLYTACGTTLLASTDRATDMTYMGSLALSFTEHGRIHALSQSGEAREIMLLEAEPLKCDPSARPGQCYTRLGIFESDFLNRSALYSVPPIEVDDSAYAQRGLFVFHSANGAHRYMISRLSALPGLPAETHYLSVLQ